MAIFDNANGRAYARLAGVFYLTIAMAGGVSIAYVPAQIFVIGDPLQSLNNITTQRGLFYLGLLGDTVMMVCEVMLTAMLFFMFRAVNPTLALAAALARFAMVGVMAAMLFFHAATLALAEPTGALATLGDAHRAGLAALSIGMHDAGVGIWQIFFALHLLILGWLVLCSGQYPAVLGVAMMLGAWGYVFDTVHVHVMPGAQWMEYPKIGLLIVVTLAEIGFALWLILRGPRRATPLT